MDDDKLEKLRRALRYRAEGKIDREAAVRWLGVHWVRSKRNCPICTGTDWGVGDDVVWLMTKQGSRYPSIVVSCNTCGHMLLFSAAKMNLLPPDAVG